MVKSRSARQGQAKKDGAGGKFTWGGVLDVIDYLPVGDSNAAKVFASPESGDAKLLSSQREKERNTLARPLILDAVQFPALTSHPGMCSPKVLWPLPRMPTASAPVVVPRTAHAPPSSPTPSNTSLSSLHLPSPAASLSASSSTWQAAPCISPPFHALSASPRMQSPPILSAMSNVKAIGGLEAYSFNSNSQVSCATSPHVAPWLHK